MKVKKTKSSGLQMKSNRKHFEKLVFLVVGRGALAREEEREGGTAQPFELPTRVLV